MTQSALLNPYLAGWSALRKVKQLGVTTFDFMLWSLMVVIVFLAVIGLLDSLIAGSKMQDANKGLYSLRLGIANAKGIRSSYSGIYTDTLGEYKSLSSTFSITGLGAASIAKSSSGAVYKLRPTADSVIIEASWSNDVCRKLLPNLDSSWVSINGKKPPLKTSDIEAACDVVAVQIETR